MTITSTTTRWANESEINWRMFFAKKRDLPMGPAECMVRFPLTVINKKETTGIDVIDVQSRQFSF